MLNLPQSTEFSKRIPKQKFYENTTVIPEMKRAFIAQIKVVYWQNKIAPSTMNLAVGEQVQEIEVFEIRLNEPRLDETVLRQIDKAILYHTLFILTCDGKAQAWIGYKEAAASGSNAFKVSRYYHTDWMPEEELHLRIEGLNMDAVYAGFLRQIAQMQRGTWNAEYGIAENVERDEKRKRLEKQIAALENKMRKEKQLNRRIEMNTELKQLRRELEAVK